MAEVAAPPTPDAMEGVAAAAPEVPAVPEEPEYISETLYIQNLNEKIKIDGMYRCVAIGEATKCLS